MTIQDGMIVEAYGMGMERGADVVLDLIEKGIRGDALRERATQRVAHARERYQAGLEAERLSQQQRGPRLFLVNGGRGYNKLVITRTPPSH
jgi:hypothetical protein